MITTTAAAAVMIATTSITTTADAATILIGLSLRYIFVWPPKGYGSLPTSLFLSGDNLKTSQATLLRFGPCYLATQADIDTED